MQRITQGEEDILRRVFQLTYLNSVRYANYRQIVNPDSVNSNDAIKIDYDYACIKRTTMEKIIQSIVDQPGERYSFLEVRHMVETLKNISLSTGSYQLDKSARQLVILESKGTLKPVVIIEECPRVAAISVSFLISFMKEHIPDLLGERQVQSFKSESVASLEDNNPMRLISCDLGKRELPMMIEAHYLSCSLCNNK